jgi:6-phosphofructokinase 2
MPGPTLSEAEWQACLDQLRALDPKPDYLVASGSLAPGAPEDFFGRAARIGAELGARVIVDTSGEALRHAVNAGVYLLKPNLRELSQLAGRELSDEDEQEAAAREIIESGGSEAVVLSLSAAGVLLVTRDLTERQRTPAVPIRSRVGAGDSMVAGIALSLARGESLRNAVCFGLAASAASVMQHGTQLCSREDTERLYARLLASSAGSV